MWEVLVLLLQHGSAHAAHGTHITPLAGLFKHEPSQLPLGGMQPGLAATKTFFN